MPVYEYECSVCGCRFERRQRFDEEPIGVCPRCKGETRRILQPVPVFFKGSGFYCTDHGRSWQGTAAKKTEEKPSSPENPLPESSSQTSPNKDTAVKSKSS